jgi:hypothetical protein
MEPNDLDPHGWLVVDSRGNESLHRDYGHAMQYCQDNHGTIDALVKLEDALAVIESLFEPAQNGIGRI